MPKRSDIGPSSDQSDPCGCAAWYLGTILQFLPSPSILGCQAWQWPPPVFLPLMYRYTVIALQRLLMSFISTHLHPISTNTRSIASVQPPPHLASVSSQQNWPELPIDVYTSEYCQKHQQCVISSHLVSFIGKALLECIAPIRAEHSTILYHVLSIIYQYVVLDYQYHCIPQQPPVIHTTVLYYSMMSYRLHPCRCCLSWLFLGFNKKPSRCAAYVAIAAWRRRHSRLFHTASTCHCQLSPTQPLWGR